MKEKKRFQELSLRSGESEERPAFLLLRSFSRTGVTDEPAMADVSSWFSSKTGAERVYRTAVDDILEALYSVGRVISLGSLDEGHYGTIIVSTRSANWEAALEKFAPLCRALIMIPDMSSGISREMEIVGARAWHQRTLVHMPAFIEPSTPDEDRAKEWEEARASLARSGIVLPPYTYSGLLYIPNPDLSVAEAIELYGKPTAEQVRTLLALMPPGGAAFAEVVPHIRDWNDVMDSR